MNEIFIIFGLFFFFCASIIFLFSFSIKKNNNKLPTQEAYQHYAKFYNIQATQDMNFDNKLSKIINLVKYQKVTDIRHIAGEVGCTLEEAILKISYLENSKILNNIHIDKNTFTIIECSIEDEKLIRKYIPYVYHNHYSLDEITNKLRLSNHYDFDDVKTQIYDELSYLIENDFIHGIKLDPIDKKIIYLSTGKDKTSHSKDLITINCPRCGALNDINRGVKSRCIYCNSILEDKPE